MKKLKVLLLKDFNCSLPTGILAKLQEVGHNCLIETVKGVTDFNRWELSVRQDSSVISFFEKELSSSNELRDKVSVVAIKSLNGYIETDSFWKETWQSN